MAESVHEYPPEDLLWGGYVLKKYDEDLLYSFLKDLTPSTARIAVVGKSNKSKVTLKEKWYETEYHVEDIPQEKIDAWTTTPANDALVLPEPNEFIPKNLEICSVDEDFHTLPRNVYRTKLVKLW